MNDLGLLSEILKIIESNNKNICIVLWFDYSGHFQNQLNERIPDSEFNDLQDAKETIIAICLKG